MKEYILSKQLLRSGTSVGAMVREAEITYYISSYHNQIFTYHIEFLYYLKKSDKNHDLSL